MVQEIGLEVGVAALYLGAAMAQGLAWRGRVAVSQGFISLLSGCAWGLQGLLLQQFGLLSVLSALSSLQGLFLVVWLCVGVGIVLAAWRQSQAPLLLGLLPFTAAMVLLLPFVEKMGQVPLADLFHALSAGVTVSVLLLCGGIASLLLCQEHWLQQKTGGRLRTPPLQTTEQLLFYTLKFAVALLTLVAISSVLFFGQRILSEVTVQHKLTLVLGVWGIFAGLLWGHGRFGWRGMPAALASLLGVALSVMVYVWSAYAW